MAEPLAKIRFFLRRSNELRARIPLSRAVSRTITRKGAAVVGRDPPMTVCAPLLPPSPPTPTPPRHSNRSTSRRQSVHVPPPSEGVCLPRPRDLAQAAARPCPSGRARVDQSAAIARLCATQRRRGTNRRPAAASPSRRLRAARPAPTGQAAASVGTQPAADGRAARGGVGDGGGPSSPVCPPTLAAAVVAGLPPPLGPAAKGQIGAARDPLPPPPPARPRARPAGRRGRGCRPRAGAGVPKRPPPPLFLFFRSGGHPPRTLPRGPPTPQTLGRAAG